MDKSTFHISDVLSIISESLLSTKGMQGVQDLLTFMTTDEIYTHQVPEAMKEVRPLLVEQFPDLCDIEVKDVTEISLRKWLQPHIEKHGEYLEVHRSK